MSFPMGLLTALLWLMEKGLSFLRFFSPESIFYCFPASLVLAFQIPVVRVFSLLCCYSAR